jgi:hypothetical protein
MNVVQFSILIRNRQNLCEKEAETKNWTKPILLWRPSASDYRYEIAFKRIRVWDKAVFYMDRELYNNKKVLESTSYLLPSASKTSFNEWYAKPSRAPTLICLTCCALLVWSKVGT